MELKEQKIYCPYCGENIDVLVDESGHEQDYYEDCSVCCRPIRFQLSVDATGDTLLSVLRDDE